MSTRMLQNIVVVAKELRKLGLDELVFVGGATIGLMLTDEAAPEVRPTLDVDLVSPARTLMEYYRIEALLRNAGFTQPLGEDNPICRWTIRGVPVDVMPMEESVLGFSNRWYGALLENAELKELPDGSFISMASAPYLVATKLEAFAGRGGEDYRVSHDLEDIIILVDGRSELAQEIASAPDDVRAFIAESFRSLLRNSEFESSIPGYLDPDEPSQARESIIRKRMEAIRDAK